MKKTILLTALAGFIFTSCDKKTETTEGVDVTTENSDVATDMDTNKAWAGTYHGVLPCADCEGIETEIMLHDNNTYMSSSTYQGKETDNQFSEEGTITWNEDNTQFTLTPSDANEKASNYKIVDNNTIVMLNEDGTEVTGKLADAYILKKN